MRTGMIDAPDERHKTTEFKGKQCPRCGSTLLTNGVFVWCSFVGGRTEKACAYGMDDIPIRQNDTIDERRMVAVGHVTRNGWHMDIDESGAMNPVVFQKSEYGEPATITISDNSTPRQVAMMLLLAMGRKWNEELVEELVRQVSV